MKTQIYFNFILVNILVVKFSDEVSKMEGPLKQCSKNQFRCNDGFCINKEYKCDNISDCPDESDEENCPKPKTCEKNAWQWQCNSGECIPKPWRCDTHTQCKDGSDEKNCDIVFCSKDQRKCSDAEKCIPLTRWCDGEKDCQTGEDEKDCPCKLDEYKCKNGQCLDKKKLCRKEISCGEEDLNINCTNLPPNTHEDCPLNFFACDYSASNIKCIPFEGWCNKTIECPNKEDEKQCACDEDKVKCDGDETCIFSKCICDNKEDCVDGSDEKGCFPLVKQDLAEEYCSLGFKCSDETCISSEKVCNGINDCADGIDESGDCDKCQENNGGCQQICHNYPTGAICSCMIGFILSKDGITCEAIDKETGGIPGNCSASPFVFGTCLLLPFGLVSCRCDDGYKGTLCDVELNLKNCSSAYLALGLTLGFISIILVIYCYKKQLCHGFLVKKKSNTRNVRFFSPSYVLIEDSMSQPLIPPIRRSIKANPKLPKQASQNSNDLKIKIDH